jgi:prepilin-type N-terminal cleavage/methylation domain-containing protein
MGRHSQTKLHHTKLNNRGFTMIEVVVVLIVMAIMGAVIIYKYTSVNADVSSETEILKASLRFAQIKALDNAVDDDTWGISFTSGGSSYSLVYIKGGVQTSPINLPGEYTLSSTHILPSGMTITGSVVNFDKWGKNPDGNDINIVLNQGGSAGTTIRIAKYTGHIQIQ